MLNLSEILIIYFSCGAPIAVYSILNRSRSLELSDSILLIIRFVFWPIYVMDQMLQFLKLKLSSEQRSTKLFTSDDLESLQSAFENALGIDGNTIRAYDFRESFHRYTGLAIAESAVSASVAKVFEVSDHPNPEIASFCLSRRNLRRLNEKVERARIDLFDLVFSTGKMDQVNLRPLVLKLADTLGDIRLRRMVPDNSVSAVISSNPTVPDEYWIEHANA